MKLSQAQRRVLWHLDRGAVIHRIGGLHARIWLSNTGDTVNWGTHHVLQKAGMIEAFKSAPNGLDPDYRITDIGRTALQSAAPPPSGEGR